MWNTFHFCGRHFLSLVGLGKWAYLAQVDSHESQCQYEE